MRGSQCDSPVALIEDTFAFLGSRFTNSSPATPLGVGVYPPQPPFVDLVLWTGDTSRHDRDSNLPRKYKDIMSANEQAVSLFSRTFNLSSTIVVPTIGNWEVYPSDDLDPDGAAQSFKDLWQLWKPLFADAPASEGKAIKQSFKAGGYFARTIRPPTQESSGLKVISLNSIWLYKQNSKVSDCPKLKSHLQSQSHPATPMFEWLRSTLNEARTANYTTIIISHIPPLDLGDPLYNSNCLDSYTAIIGEFSDVILFSTHGHTNKDTVSFVSKTKNGYDIASMPGAKISAGSIVGMVWTAPSVYPVFNPGFRIGRMSAPEQSWQIDGWTQWYADVVDENNNYDDSFPDNASESSYRIQYSIEYDTSVEYGLPNLTASAFSTWYRLFVTNSGGINNNYSRFIYVGTSPVVPQLGLAVIGILVVGGIFAGLAT
ncbi:Endopolyphosphatase [Gonapodya sp. JEL0774]|nr:Endopolyphosphatase [Gonapodya sp. JEL0774]